MKFYGRSAELEALRGARKMASHNAQFTIVTGRRRVGKTELINKAFNDGAQDYVYLLITRQLEKPLCAMLQSEIERVLGYRISMLGKAERLIELVKVVFQAAVDKPLTLVIDEFQDIDKIDSAFYSELQGLWDQYHKQAKINFVVSGSIYRLMTKIFFNRHEPLYGRCTAHLHLDPFPVSVVKEILADHNPRYSNDDLLTLWTITGGVAKYIELLMDVNANCRKKMIKAFFGSTATFIDEGRNVLSDEFGKDNGTYFSIMASIASGRTRFSEIENSAGVEVGTYLANLERTYGLIRKTLPLFAKATGKNAAYGISDCFFRFWFRFVFKNQNLIELKRYDVLQDLVQRDLDAFSGKALESYFTVKFIEEKRYTQIGGWWDRRSENEIDLVCDDEVSGRLDFFEVKRDPKRINIAALQKKSEAFFAKNPQMARRKVSFGGLSILDM